ncbi:uncharacterized protein LOC133652721 [Entelurus aequoreus]|uniref:uncharacterized protein LOC133652721 n=1 Tax=Entelurus aequoreus TaxID=161455 RepID=UPI002B1D9AF8|nr:uncharacterized protein LOC133652721 [Entelurus aequoreus]
MSQDDVTFRELLELAFGTPRAGVVDFGALHRLLRALLTHLGVGESSTAQQTHLQLLGRIQACEDQVVTAMKLIQEVQQQIEQVKRKGEELQESTCETLDGVKDVSVRLQDRVMALEAGRKVDEDQLEQLITNTDQRDMVRILDERLNIQQDAINSLSDQLHQLDNLQVALDHMLPPLTSDPSGDLEDGGETNVGRTLSLRFERKMAEVLRRHEDTQHEHGPQASILQLQRDCHDLREAIGGLHDDNKHKHVHIQQLLRSQEELQERKVDRHSLHTTLCQLDKQIQDQWNDIQDRMLLPEPSQQVHAAGIRKQLLCLSCDPPVITHLHAPGAVSPSRTLTNFTDFRYPRVSRSCGGVHTVTSGPQRSVNGWKHCSQTAGGATVQSEATKTVGTHEALSKEGHFRPNSKLIASRSASAQARTPQSSSGRIFGARSSVAPPLSRPLSTS